MKKTLIKKEFNAWIYKKKDLVILDTSHLVTGKQLAKVIAKKKRLFEVK